MQKKITYPLAILAAFLLLPGIAHADENKTFVWTVPTENTDGSALAAADLTKYDLGCRPTVVAARTVYTSWPITDPAETSRVISFPAGSYFCSLRVYATIAVTPSDWSNEVFFSILVPNPPTDLSVT